MGKGVGKKLLMEFEAIAQKFSHRIDFLFLVSDEPSYYQKLGYFQTKLTTSWLKIDNHRNYGIGTEAITDTCFLVKSVSGKNWEDGVLDMLGYMY